MKKILYAVTCIFCLLTLTRLSDAQTISISKVEGEAGSIVEASIDIDSDVENVVSIDVTLTYNVELLTAKEVLTIFAGFLIIHNINDSGKVVIGGFSADGQGKTITAGPMFKVIFEVNADAKDNSTSELVLEEMVIFNADGKNIDLEIQNGEFKVNKNIPSGMTVEGNVLEADGQSLAHGVAAVAAVTHEKTGVTHSEEILNGKYSLKFLEDETKLMANGDNVIIEIKSIDETILFGSDKYLLTQSEIDADFLQAPDITTNRVSEFAIKGRVTDAKVNPIESAVVSALNVETSTNANGEYAISLKDYPTNPAAGDVVEIYVRPDSANFPVVRMRKTSFQVELTMLENRGVEDIDVSVNHIRIGGLTLDITQHMNVIDKATKQAGVPIRIRDFIEMNPEFASSIEEVIKYLFTSLSGPMSSLVSLSLALAPIDTPPELFEQQQNMDWENFGNPIVPYPPAGTDYLESLKILEGNVPLKVTGNKLDLYLITPEYAGDVNLESGLGTVQIERVAPKETLITHRFQLEEELALMQLSVHPDIIETDSFGVFDSVILYYTSAIMEAPEPGGRQTLQDIYRDSVEMTEQIINGKVVWTASQELELGKKYYYFFEVELKQPLNILIGREKHEVSRWVMPDPKNMQIEDSGLFSELFRTPEWFAFFSPVVTPILNGQPIPEEATHELTNYLASKSDEIVADALNPVSDNYLDPRIVSEFKTPSIAAGESLWLARFDVDALEGDYEITFDVKDADGNLMDHTDVQIGIDQKFTPMIFSISNWQDTPMKVLDLNGDGIVDISDLVIVGSHLGEKTSSGDVNRDGIVDIFDLLLVSSHFGE